MTSVQVQNARNFLAYTDTHEFDKIADLLCANFTHTILPASIGIPKRSRDEYLSHVRNVGKMFEVINLQDPYETITSKDIVIFHMAADGKTAHGFPYKSEFMFTFRFEGDKIASVSEFVDSKHVTEVIGKEKAAAAA